jgi:hypothetical protein
MKTALEIKQLAQSVHITPAAEADKRILDAAEAALERVGTQLPNDSLPLWRTILEGKPSKLALAALVLVVLMLGILLFDLSPDGSSTAWADIVDAMKQQPWIFMYSDNGHNISQWWLCPEEKITIHDYNGDVTYNDFKTGITHHYDKESNTAEIRKTIERPDMIAFDDPQALIEIFNRPYQEFENVRKGVELSGSDPSISRGHYRGFEVQIQCYQSKDTALNKNEDGSWLVLYIDAQSSLLRGYTEWAHSYVGGDPNNLTYTGVEKGERAYDYPNPGPQTIYDVGVPKDAKVIKRYDEQFIKLLPTYKRFKQAGLERIACVLTSYNIDLPQMVMQAEQHNNPNGPVSQLSEPLGPVAMHFDVFYFDGPLFSVERRFNLKHNISGAGNMIRNWPECQRILGSSYSSQMAWLNQHERETFGSIRVSDGQYACRLSKHNGTYRFQKHLSPQWDPRRYGELAKKTWPELDVRAKCFEDDYANQHDFVGVKHTQRIKGHKEDDIFLYYLNPEKDYLCHKQVILWGHGLKQVHEVESYQYVNEQWYPKRINYGSQRPNQTRIKFDDFTILHIDETADFTESVFDVSAVEELYKVLQ